MACVDQYESTRPRVLVVDDSELVLGILRGMLASLGYEVALATTPDEALARVTLPRHSFVAIVVDEKIPPMSGVQFVTRLRERGIRLPALVIGTTTPPGSVPAVAKPFTPTQLARALCQIGIYVPSAPVPASYPSGTRGRS